jgi:hypothetical protein
MEYRPRGSFLSWVQDVDGATRFPFQPSSHPPHPAYHMQFHLPYPHFMAPSPTPGSTHNSLLASSSRSPSPANVGQHRVTIDVEAADE